MAFPPRMVQVLVPESRPAAQAVPSRRERSLALVDGGVADNTGLQLLQTTIQLAADRTAANDPSTPASDIDREWDVEALIASDAGAAFQRDEDYRGISALTRAIDVITQQVLGATLG